METFLISLFGIYYETCVICDKMGQVVIYVILYHETPGCFPERKNALA
jgi:hypothetical protein